MRTVDFYGSISLFLCDCHAKRKASFMPVYHCFCSFYKKVLILIYFSFRLTYRLCKKRWTIWRSARLPIFQSSMPSPVIVWRVSTSFLIFWWTQSFIKWLWQLFIKCRVQLIIRFVFYLDWRVGNSIIPVLFIWNTFIRLLAFHFNLLSVVDNALT